MWKETAVVQFKAPFRHLPKGWRKNTKATVWIADFWAGFESEISQVRGRSAAPSTGLWMLHMLVTEMIKF
jgi:hypothetical protein